MNGTQRQNYRNYIYKEQIMNIDHYCRRDRSDPVRKMALVISMLRANHKNMSVRQAILQVEESRTPFGRCVLTV